MTCLFFHRYEWTETGTNLLCNLMGFCSMYRVMEGRCTRCQHIKYKNVRIV